MDLRDYDGHRHGPAFCTAQGKPLTSSALELDLLDCLQRVQDLKPTLIPLNIQVHESYGISRFFRRGATSEARARGVSPEDIDLTNCWRTFTSTLPSQARPLHHYSDIRLLITFVFFHPSPLQQTSQLAPSPTVGLIGIMAARQFIWGCG